MTNDCKTCPVSTGTHKPAEAVHQIGEPQADALRLADECEESATHWVHEIDTRAKAAKMLRAQHARIAELEQRLEIDPRHRYDGISARDATIEAQDERIEDLEAQLEAIGAGGVEPLRKGFVRLTDVLARLEQGFGANSAPVTTIKRHFEMQAAPAPDERAAFEAWLRIKPCGAAHDFGWAAWQARAALAATQPAAQGMDVVKAAKALCKHAAKVQNINFDDYWLIHAEEFKEEAQIVLDAAQAKQGGA